MSTYSTTTSSSSNVITTVPSRTYTTQGMTYLTSDQSRNLIKRPQISTNTPLKRTQNATTLAQGKQQHAFNHGCGKTKISSLTIGIVALYTTVNENYYKARAREKKNNSPTTQQEKLLMKRKEAAMLDYSFGDQKENLFNNRYIVCKDRALGNGSFGQVFEATDTLTNKIVAIKIIKKKGSYTSQARFELKLYKHMFESKDKVTHPFGLEFIVNLLDHFVHKGHTCLVFERLQHNLYELIRAKKFQGFNLQSVRRFAVQLLNVLEYLAQPEINIIHCDLKPENVVLASHQRRSIKVIDFGSSCFLDHQPYEYVQSRFYRSPEALFGMKNYTQAIDMWSLGCILYEMHTGHPLFAAQTVTEQIKRMINTLGPPSNEFCEMLPEAKRSIYFEKCSNQNYKLKNLSSKCLRDREGIYHQTTSEKNYKSLLDMLKDANPEDLDIERTTFFDLLQKMLDYNPNKRIKPREALCHPFISKSYRQRPETSKNCSSNIDPSNQGRNIVTSSLKDAVLKQTAPHITCPPKSLNINRNQSSKILRNNESSAIFKCEESNILFSSDNSNSRMNNESGQKIFRKTENQMLHRNSSSTNATIVCMKTKEPLFAMEPPRKKRLNVRTRDFDPRNMTELANRLHNHTITEATTNNKNKNNFDLTEVYNLDAIMYKNEHKSPADHITNVHRSKHRRLLQ